MKKIKQYQWWIDNVPKQLDTFIGWLGTTEDISRIWLRNFMRDNSIKSVLDVACGVCIDKQGFDNDKLNIKYRGIDTSEFLVNRGKDNGYDCVVGNIEDIPEQDKSWELVFGRHIIEHLEYYEKAIEEMCRVASKCVVVIHFLPMAEMDKIVISDTDNVYNNEYREDRFVKYCEQFGKVERILLEENRQSITLIRL